MMSTAEFVPAFAPAASLPEGAALVFPFIGDILVLDASHELPDPARLAALGPSREARVVGHLAGRPCVLVQWPKETPFPADLRKGHYRQIWPLWPAAPPRPLP